MTSTKPHNLLNEFDKDALLRLETACRTFNFDDEAQWREVVRKLRPDITDEEFEAVMERHDEDQERDLL